MRVIAGNLKRRILKTVPGKSTRPTSDKVKEAVFHMLGPFFEEGICLDLFAGSGSLGIEAISRGMEQAIFIEKNGKAVKTIEENIKLVNIKDRVEIIRMDAYRSLRVLGKRQNQFDLIFIDPPYATGNYENLIKDILKLQLLKNNGIIYCEHAVSDNLPAMTGQLDIIKSESYGGTTGITIYRMQDK